jgi:hypothetical protein
MCTALSDSLLPCPHAFQDDEVVNVKLSIDFLE